MDSTLQALSLRTGKQLQLLIAGAHDLPQYLEPLRRRRARRSARVAAGVGAATSAMLGGAMWMANLGFWASVGAALGLASLPVMVGVAGLGGLALGMPRRREENDERYALQCEQVALTLTCFQRMAEADGRISAEERILLRQAMLQFPLAEQDRQRLDAAQSDDALADDVLAHARAIGADVRRQVLRGTWMLAEADGVTPEEEQVFEDLAQRLDLQDESQSLRRESRDLQAAVNDLVTAMFRTCQQVLAPALGQAPANEFLEALALIAATPQSRRSLRNSLRSGFSAGGVAQLLEQHAQVDRLIAQACNAIRAVYGADEAGRKAGRTRLLDLADATSLGRGKVRPICADVDLLFDEALDSAAAQAAGATRPPPPPARG